MDASLTSGTTQPLWLANLTRASYPALEKNASAEICIIGAGITGLTSAYCLLRAGKQVVVIDDGKIGSGETSRTTAHLSNALDDRYINIADIHGKEAAALAAQSHSAAINFIEQIVKNEKIDCDFKRVNGYLFADSKENTTILSKELSASQEAGIKTQMVEQANVGQALLFPEQAQFHPMKYLEALAKIIVQLGGEIYENTHASEIKNKDNKIVISTASNHTVSCKAAIQATNAPINTSPTFHAKQIANRTYVIAAAMPKDALEMALYWDTADPYHYIRLQMNDDGQQYVIIGGADHRTGDNARLKQSPFNVLENWARKRFPEMQEIAYRWSGQVLEPIDYLSFSGHNANHAKNVYIATGDSGNGITHGTLSAILISDLICTNKNNCEKVYDPSRLVMRPFKDFMSNSVELVKAFTRYLFSDTILDASKLSPGQGAICREGIKNYAIYRDEQGKIHKFSAACPHQKAMLAWNPEESTWDCPAHGSRFAPTGEVVNSPASCGMKCLKNE